MTKKISTILLAFLLACSMIVAMPVGVDAKSKAINKPFYIASTYFTNSSEEPGNLSLYAYAKNAKKYEVYRSRTVNGKFKKVTTLGKNGKSIKAPNGLYFYKIRGVNGSKKGKFTKLIPIYKTGFEIIDSTVDYSDNSILLKIFVDNSTSKDDMLFDSSKIKPVIDVSYKLDESEFKYSYRDEEGYYYDEDDEEVTNIASCMAKGKLVDEKGNLITSASIKKNEAGYIYLKLKVDEDTIEGCDNASAIKYVKKALDKLKMDMIEEGDIVMLNLNFQIKSGKKLYKLSANLCPRTDAAFDYGYASVDRDF